MLTMRNLLIVPALGLMLAMPTGVLAQADAEAGAKAADPASMTTDASQISTDRDGAAAAPQPPPIGALLAERIRSMRALPAGRDRDERTALAGFYAARTTPLWIEDGKFNARADAVIAEITKADDWGLTASDYRVPSAPAGSDAALDAEIALSLTVLQYARHARGGRMDPTQLSFAIDRQPPLLDPASVMEGVATASAADEYLRKLHPQHPQFERLRKLYNEMRAGTFKDEEQVVAAQPEPEPEAKGKKRRTAKKAASPPRVVADARKVLHNMEMWRWMPETLGDTHIQANIPEFQFRVVKDGRVVHAERIITGKVETQTPTFSDEMEFIEFHPSWGVPASIKVKELLPGLARGGDPLGRQGLQVIHRGREVSASSIDWSRTDIRSVSIIHPPGPRNPLGVVKFMFPNKHDVYMHDTPTKNLFNADVRTFSHGCVRVRNPVKLAEVILGLDQGWTPERVAATIKSGKNNNEVRLRTRIPVHLTYFTVTVDDNGKPTFYRDIYGHERLIQMGLEGKAHLIVKKKDDLNTLARSGGSRVVGRLADTRPGYQNRDWISQLFGGF